MFMSWPAVQNIIVLSTLTYVKVTAVVFFYYYYYLVCEVIGTAATPSLLCQPRVIMKMMIVEKQMECRLARETNRSSRRKPDPTPLFFHHKIPYDQTPGLNPGHRGGKPATNRLSYVAAHSWGSSVYHGSDDQTIG
jgi:hypothetical protein